MRWSRLTGPARPLHRCASVRVGAACLLLPQHACYLWQSTMQGGLKGPGRGGLHRPPLLAAGLAHR